MVKRCYALSWGSQFLQIYLCIISRDWTSINVNWQNPSRFSIDTGTYRWHVHHGYFVSPSGHWKPNIRLGFDRRILTCGSSRVIVVNGSPGISTAFNVLYWQVLKSLVPLDPDGPIGSLGPEGPWPVESPRTDHHFADMLDLRKINTTLPIEHSDWQEKISFWPIMQKLEVIVSGTKWYHWICKALSCYSRCFGRNFNSRFSPSQVPKPLEILCWDQNKTMQSTKANACKSV